MAAPSMALRDLEAEREETLLMSSDQIGVFIGYDLSGTPLSFSSPMYTLIAERSI